MHSTLTAQLACGGQGTMVTWEGAGVEVGRDSHIVRGELGSGVLPGNLGVKGL